MNDEHPELRVGILPPNDKNETSVVVCKPLYQLFVACAFVGAHWPRDLSCSMLFQTCVVHEGSVELNRGKASRPD